LLKEKHYNELEIDVSEGLWLLLGRALHLVAEQGADSDHIVEERLYAEVGGWTISGAIDLQKMEDGGATITDYKLTSAWAYSYGKPEWEHQLNSYAWLATVSKGYKVAGLQVCAIFRDWSVSRAKSRNYPPSPVALIPIPLWEFEKQDVYIRERVALHQEAWRAHEWGDDLPPCSDEERWLRKGKYVRCERYCPVKKWCKQYGGK
jgi:hypothetical protein